MQVDKVVTREEKIERVLKKKQPDFTLVFEEVKNPHNIYAITRTCDSMGILDMHAVYKKGSSMPSPKKSGKRSSSSGNKWINVINHDDIDECMESIRNEGFLICCTDLRKDSVSIYDFDFTRKIALVVGNERYGVSDSMSKHADHNLFVPQIGMIRSLNVSVATAVILYEAYRQRLDKGHYNKCKLSPLEYKNLHDKWMLK